MFYQVAYKVIFSLAPDLISMKLIILAFYPDIIPYLTTLLSAVKNIPQTIRISK